MATPDELEARVRKAQDAWEWARGDEDRVLRQYMASELDATGRMQWPEKALDDPASRKEIADAETRRKDAWDAYQKALDEWLTSLGRK